jgi:hypothetical protein
MENLSLNRRELKGGEGTRVAVYFKFRHNRQATPSCSDISGTVVTLIAGNPDVKFIYRHQNNGQVYILDTSEIKKRE